jgi:hypothetical protein
MDLDSLTFDELLDKIKIMSRNGKLAEKTQQDILDAIKNVLSNEDKKIDEEMKCYLFLGWYISQHACPSE